MLADTTMAIGNVKDVLTIIVSLIAIWRFGASAAYKRRAKSTPATPQAKPRRKILLVALDGILVGMISLGAILDGHTEISGPTRISVFVVPVLLMFYVWFIASDRAA